MKLPQFKVPILIRCILCMLHMIYRCNLHCSLLVEGMFRL